MRTRRALAPGLLALALLAPGVLSTQPRPASPAKPGLSASRSVMAGSMLTVFLTGMPAGTRLAIARPADPASSAIVVVEATAASAVLPAPGEIGLYELRLTAQRDGAPVILVRQPLATTEPRATLSAPARVGRGQGLPARGIGPNGEQDRVVLVPKDAAADAAGPSFFPAENVEATLEAPEQAGEYELRYVMHAPLAEHRILARQPVAVE